MLPITRIFMSRNRRRPGSDRSVLDEEYEWVFGPNSPSARKSNRRQPAQRRDGSSGLG